MPLRLVFITAVVWAAAERRGRGEVLSLFGLAVIFARISGVA
jgi:hypothetical protein